MTQLALLLCEIAEKLVIRGRFSAIVARSFEFKGTKFAKKLKSRFLNEKVNDSCCGFDNIVFMPVSTFSVTRLLPVMLR